MMRIVIDMQGAQSRGNRHRGIGRYVFEFAKGMCRQRGEHEIILALNGAYPDTAIQIRDEFKTWLTPEQIRVWQAPGPLHHLGDDEDGRRKIAEEVRFAFMNSLKPSVVINGAVFESISEDSVTTIQSKDEGATYITAAILHDLIPLIRKEEYLDPSEIVKKWYLHHLDELKKCDYFLANSGSTRNEAIEYLNWPSERVTNISAAVSANFFPETLAPQMELAIREKFDLTKPFVMYTGGMDRRKNVEGLVEAFGMLPQEVRDSHKLAIVCKLAPSQIEALGKLMQQANLPESAVVLTGFVSDDELVSLYRLCKLFVFPSWHEGFGLPLLEAMNCGKAVLCGDESAMPEVVGIAEAFFDAHDPTSIAEKMQEVLSSEVLRARLEAHSIEYSKNFSWDISARRAIDALIARVGDGAGEVLGTNKNTELLQELITRVQNQAPRPAQAEYWVQLASCLDRTLPPQDTLALKRVFVDVTELARRDARSGIQRVVRAVLMNWLNNPPSGYQIELVRASDDGIGYLLANQFKKNFLGSNDQKFNDDPIGFYPGDTFIGLDLQPVDVPRQINFFTLLGVWGVNRRFVVYDLLPLQFPEYFGDGADVRHAQWLSVVARSDGAVCISRSVAQELTDYFEKLANPPHSNFQIDWFHLGADIDQSAPSLGMPADANEILEKISTGPTFLMVGTIEPRKGHAQVLDAFDQIWQDNIHANLIIVGKSGWKMESVQSRIKSHINYQKKLFWLDGISDQYLNEIYAGSTALLAASEGEGFGLPLIEAAQREIPILARDIPVFREVAQDHAFYFKSVNGAELASAIKDWITLNTSGTHPASHGLPWKSWKESSEDLLSTILNQAKSSVEPTLKNLQLASFKIEKMDL